MKALALIDMQNDFIDGSLGVGTERFYRAWDNTRRLIAEMKPDLVLVTMDYHPKDHCSFTTQGGMWDPHCVQGTGGVKLNWKVFEFIDSLSRTPLTRIEDYPLMLLKGKDPNQDEYGVNLLDADRYVSYLARGSIRDITELHIVGLCTDYCVKNCALETSRNNRNLPIIIHTDCCVAIDPSRKLDLYEYGNIKVVDNEPLVTYNIKSTGISRDMKNTHQDFNGIIDANNICVNSDNIALYSTTASSYNISDNLTKLSKIVYGN